MTLGLKYGRDRLPERIAGSLWKRWNRGLFSDFFGAEVLVLPVPGHAPIRDGSSWPIQDLAIALEKYSMCQARSWLQRTKRVQKSAFADPGQRPTSLDHYSSISLYPDSSLFRPAKITVLDDVVTRGATLYGCVRRVRDAFPDAEVVAFAVVRTLSNVPLIDKMIHPVEEGTIRSDLSGSTLREP